MSQVLATLGGVVNLTPPQAEAVVREGSFTVRGSAGTGKTTVLCERYLRGNANTPTSRKLVVCADAARAGRFRQSVVPALAGGFDSLAITTAWRLAFDIVTRHAHADASAVPATLLGGSERRSVLSRLLSAEAGNDDLWPTLHPLVGRDAFLDAVDAGFWDLAAQDPATRASAAPNPRSDELIAFASRFADHCRASGRIDAVSVVPQALAVLDESDVRFDEILVDDAETLTPAAIALVQRLAVDAPIVIATDPGGATWHLEPVVELAQSFRQAAAAELIECRHPSVEPEAIAGELLAAHERGVAWNDMAVIAPAHRVDAVVRSMARHQVPAAAMLRHRVRADALPRGIVDLVAWAGGDGDALARLLSSPLAALDAAGVRALQRRAIESQTRLTDLPEVAPLVEARDAVARVLADGDLSGACHEAFRRAASALVHLPGEPVPAVEQHSLDAAVAFLNRLDRAGATDLDEFLASFDDEIDVEPWWGDDSGDGSDEVSTTGVTIGTVAGAAGREWSLVIVAGCVEGSFPRVARSPRFFEQTEVAEEERLHAALDAERRRFSAACTRATDTLLATAAPEPGVLVSRFVDGWPRRAALLPFDAPAAPASVASSEGVAPVWPTGALLLSASQLDTYEDCPLKYALRYAAGVRTEAGLHADLGTVVHDVLAAFLDPNDPGTPGPHPHTFERLLEIADAAWRDDIAPYRPQVEEARRDYYDMLEAWWEGEGRLIAGGEIDVLATEHPFEVDIGPHRITGRIDRVDRASDGTGIRVLDYKTGKSRPRPDDVAANIQLATYHLAARRDEMLREWGDPTELRLLYVRSMQTYDQEVAADHEAVTEARILDAAHRILAEEFEPSVAADCDHCEFHRLCPLWPEGMEVGER